MLRPVRLGPFLLGLTAATMLWSQPAPQAPGAGDLMLTPTRLVLEGRQRAGEIILKNIGKAPATYRIQFREMAMEPTGQLKAREKAPGEITAADLIRFSPRQVELAPGEAQTVRIQVRKPEALPDGEYRSHMLFQGVPPAQVPQAENTEGEKKLTFNITPVYGMIIPIIVRHGQVQVHVVMTNMRYSEPEKPGYPPFLDLDLERTGNGSILGDFDVVVDSGGKLKKGRSVSNAKGVAVYHTVPLRNVGLPIWVDQGESVKGCRLKVTYTPQDVKQPPVIAYFDVP